MTLYYGIIIYTSLFIISFPDDPGTDMVPNHSGYKLQGAEEDPGQVPAADIRKPQGPGV